MAPLLHLSTQTSWVVFMNPWGRVPKQRISSSLHVSLVIAGAQSFIDEPEVTQQGAWKGESRTEATSPAPFHCPVPLVRVSVSAEGAQVEWLHGLYLLFH